MDESMWYLGNGGRGYGPFSTQQIQQLNETGMLAADDLIWRDGDHSAISAHRIDDHLAPISAGEVAAGSTKKAGSVPAGVWYLSGAVVLIFCVAVLSIAALYSGGLSVKQQQNSEVASTSTVGSEKATEKGAAGSPAEEATSLETPTLGTTTESTGAGIATEKTPLEAQPENEQAGIVVQGNVALASNGAKVKPGIRNPSAVNDGKPPSNYREYAKAPLRKPVVIELNDVYRLRVIKILFVGSEGYRYTLEVSVDGHDYQMVQDRRDSGKYMDWQTVTLDPQPIQFIRITGTYDEPNQSGLRIGEIEAYCTDDTNSP